MAFIKYPITYAMANNGMLSYSNSKLKTILIETAVKTPTIKELNKS